MHNRETSTAPLAVHLHAAARAHRARAVGDLVLRAARALAGRAFETARRRAAPGHNLPPSPEGAPQ